MKQEVNSDVLLRRSDDGRIQIVTVHPDGSILASFNAYPYRPIEITQTQFERYKPFLKKDDDEYEGLVEFWGEPLPRDNGFPKFINKIF